MRMRSNRNHQILLLLITAIWFSGCTPEKTPILKESTGRPAPPPEAIKQWTGQKFSMFIHFGVYSLAGGMWNGEPVTKGYSEQIRAHGGIPREEYAALAGKFNPSLWNPDSVALLAKAAGMRSIVITAKHHDGFAMFHTRQSGFNIVDATPYKRDLLKELSEACRRHGLRFGVYFSLIDWNFPQALPISDHNSDSIPPEHHRFNLKQVEELMTSYGPVSEIWFDMGKPTIRQSTELADLVRRLQPACLVSGRIWNDQGDFAVMGDNASPDFRMGTLWQTPASMFHETWGYRSWQTRGNPTEKATEKIRELVRTVANGGNYLLNIGPEGTGRIVPFEKQVLLEIGNWMSAYGRTLYESEPLYMQSDPPAFFTRSYPPSRDTGIFHVFIPAGKRSERIDVKGIRSMVTSCREVTDGRSAREFTMAGTTVTVRSRAGSTTTGPFRILEFRIPEPLTTLPDHLQSADDGPIELTLTNGTGYHSYSGPDYYTTRPTLIRMVWSLQSRSVRDVMPEIAFRAADSGKILYVSINDQPYELRLETKGVADEQNLFHLPIGNARLQEGLNTVTLRLRDQSNPHRDIGMTGMKILFP